MIKNIMDSNIQNTIKGILSQIEVAKKLSKYNQTVRLVAVSKTKSIEMIQEAYDIGQRHFGENYVEEIEKKSPLLPQDIKWHFIGHLQSNKVNKLMVPNLHCIETLDSAKLAKKLNGNCEIKNRELNVMVQLKTSEEDTKNGLSENEGIELAEVVINECSRLKFLGFMTIGKSGDIEAFELMNKAKDRAMEKFGLTEEQVELSMGMTADYEEAVKYGSNNIRIGSKIFGEREKKG